MIYQRVKNSQKIFIFSQTLENMKSFFNEGVRAPNRALFNLSYPSPDVMLTVKLYKLLQGEPEDYLGVYGKGSEIKDKDKIKIVDALGSVYSITNEKNLQGLCWGMIPLFNEDNDLFVTDQAKITTFYRMKQEMNDEEFFEASVDVTGSRRFKTISGEMNLTGEISERGIEAPIVSSSGYKVKNGFDVEGDNYFREIHEFNEGPPLYPHLEFKHNLFMSLDSLTISKTSGKNLQIMIQMFPNDDLSNEPLAVFYNREDPDILIDCYKTVISYSSKTPSFSDEIKIRLPVLLSPRMNYKFTIKHIPIKSKGEGEQIIGMTYFPVLVDGSINTLPRSVPLFRELPDKYLSSKSQDSLAKNMIDNPKKTQLSFSCKLDSSVYSDDPVISGYFNSLRKGRESIDSALNSLYSANPNQQFQWLPVLFGLIIDNMLNPENAHAAFESLITLLTTPHLSKSLFNSLLESYLGYCLVNHLNSDFQLHLTLMTIWCDYLNGEKTFSQGYDRITKVSGFLMKMIYYSMCHDLKKRKQLKGTREGRFSDDQILIIRNFAFAITQDINELYSKEFVRGNELKRSLIEFYTDMFSILEISVVIDMIKRTVNFWRENSSPSDEVNNSMFITEFIDEICSYEHLTQVNLPVQVDLNKIDYNQYWRQDTTHFITDLVTDNIAHNSRISDFLAKSNSIKVLLNILGRYESDPRYKSAEEIQKTITPFFKFVVWATNEMKDSQFEFAHKKDIYLCLLEILTKMDPKVTEHWWKNDSQERDMDFLEILLDIIYVFQLRPQDDYENLIGEGQQKSSTAKAALQSFYTDSSWGRRRTGKMSLREQRAMQRQGGTPSSDMNTKTWKKHQADFEAFEYFYDEQREYALGEIASMSLLNIISRFLDARSADINLNHIHNTVTIKVFQVLHALLKIKQSITVIKSSFSLIKKIILMFPKLLFSSNKLYLEKLCDILMTFCSFSHTSVRTQSAALMYLVIKKNFEFTKDNFSRVTSELTATLSELVTDIRDSKFIDLSLETISRYATAEKMPSNFISQVEQLTGRLQTILKDLNLINDYIDDPVMQADLYVRICDSYKSNVDLRITSLQGLAKLQVENLNLTEAAHCHIHIASLIAEYLAMEEVDDSLPSGSFAFSKLSQSCLQETISDSNKEALQGRSEMFSEDGLVSALSLAASLLLQSESYDSLNELYRLLIPIYEKRNDYGALAKCHGQLQNSYLKILEQKRTRNRFFGSYYRVAFRGEFFREMDGKEYIYKEPPLTRLSEITLRLKGYYEAKFGKRCNVHIYTKTTSIFDEKFDDLKGNCYIQITSVEPHLESWELRDRKTDFQRGHNIDKFIFSTPFTKGGKSQTDNIVDQYQRKTIITTSAPFPYLSTRLEVIEHSETELSPLDNALALIEGRIEKFTEILSSSECDTKVLQPVLTGSVSAVVHAGPMAVCLGFFGENRPTHYDEKELTNLKRALFEFIEVCKEALDKNGEMISPNEVELHEQLQHSYEEMKRTMLSVLQ
eukprot:TRINITY_DN1181_c0_g2_i2.p1 TRINITY_DN1181_c0_g2~~TRINITY_DN1181_c0_g2_i2.p1  ORF type:complete len:1501 (+),score=308.24 TRINITY_DN1181_c0_g2_i2:781-5283(+)